MPDYKEMYFELAAKMSDAIEILIHALQQQEARYMEDNHTLIEYHAQKSTCDNIQRRNETKK